MLVWVTVGHVPRSPRPRFTPRTTPGGTQTLQSEPADQVDAVVVGRVGVLGAPAISAEQCPGRRAVLCLSVLRFQDCYVSSPWRSEGAC